MKDWSVVTQGLCGLSTVVCLQHRVVQFILTTRTGNPALPVLSGAEPGPRRCPPLLPSARERQGVMVSVVTGPHWALSS